jgi:phosphatidylglycerophosphatase A
VSALARAIATLGPVGHFPIAPATAGSAVVTVAALLLPDLPVAARIAIAVPLAAVAVWSAGEAEKTLGHDARPIVIDELVGQWLAFLFVPHRVPGYLAAFVLFRVFDVWKPLGAREAQRLPGGWGILADDVIAGVTACAAYQIIAWALRELGVALL